MKTIELSAQRRINEAQESEINVRAAEIELLRKEILGLKRCIVIVYHATCFFETLRMKSHDDHFPHEIDSTETNCSRSLTYPICLQRLLNKKFPN